MKLSKEFLFLKYIEEGLSVNDISNHINVPVGIIKSSLRRFGIRKTPLKLGNATYDDKSWLYQEYVVKKKGYTVIADECGVSYTTILDRVLFFGWELRGHQDIDKGSPRKGKKHSKESIELIKKSRVRNRVTTQCNHCSKRLEIVNSAFLKSSKNYCNISCYHKYLEQNRVEAVNITDSALYKKWRLNVYKRDLYRCKMPGCNSKSRAIAAHHIYPKKLYPEKMFDIENGITLCKICHEKTYGKEAQFVEILVRVIQK